MQQPHYRQLIPGWVIDKEPTGGWIIYEIYSGQQIGRTVRLAEGFEIELAPRGTDPNSENDENFSIFMERFRQSAEYGDLKRGAPEATDYEILKSHIERCFA